MLSWQSYIVRLYLNYSKATLDDNTPIEKLRQAVEDGARFSRFPKSVQSQTVTIEHITAEWIIPSQADTRSVMLYLHGGGYALGSIKSHRATAGQIAEAGKIRTLIIEYRLAPEYPFPAALEDSLIAYKWLRKNGYEKIIIVGDSAGAGLALSTVISLRDNQISMPMQVICLSPWLDLEGTGESVITNSGRDPLFKADDLRLGKFYIGENNPHNPLISPLYADFTRLSPILIHVGADEILLSDSTRLVQKAKDAGVDVQMKVWQGMWHIFPFFAPFVPESSQAIIEIGDFIRHKID
ncbi:MAG TPA: alpha/beta hydrolase [Anaerolineales bacterium]|nr:alpha/beta hydrolase [Anaerolineales bacterium]HNF94912.1 alpha/beta hydrolase [Anaerolineales bacterium]